MFRFSVFRELNFMPSTGNGNSPGHPGGVPKMSGRVSTAFLSLEQEGPGLGHVGENSQEQAWKASA